jgi:hypothetical protein
MTINDGAAPSKCLLKAPWAKDAPQKINFAAPLDDQSKDQSSGGPNNLHYSRPSLIKGCTMKNKFHGAT